MNSSVRCILQGTKSPGTASQAAIQNHFSAQFSVCEAVNYLHLLCLFKYLDSMNGLAVGFANKEALHKAAAGRHGSALQAAPPPSLPDPCSTPPSDGAHLFPMLYYFACLPTSAAGPKRCGLRAIPLTPAQRLEQSLRVSMSLQQLHLHSLAIYYSHHKHLRCKRQMY